MGERTYSVMLSSTYKELASHRAAVSDAILSQSMFPVAMENDAALPDHDLISASLEKVDQSDAYVSLIGYRYGQQPTCLERNPEQFSLTELEFRRAVDREIPICMFIMHDEHPVPRLAMRDSANADNVKLEAFVQLAKSDRIYAEFKSVDDLKTKAVQSLVRLREALDAKRASQALTGPLVMQRIAQSEHPGAESISIIFHEAPKHESGLFLICYCLFAIAKRIWRYLTAPPKPT
jgi:hypothetical protein